MKTTKQIKNWKTIVFLSGLLLTVDAGKVQGQFGNPDKGKDSSSKEIQLAPTINTEAPRLQYQDPALIFASGMVITENGDPPPFSTIILLDCGNTSTAEAMVGSNGFFSFQVGGSNWSKYMPPDASERSTWDPYNGPASGPSIQNTLNAATLTRRLFGCELKAQSNGYRSTTIRLDKELTVGPNQFGTILIYPIGRIKGTLVSYTSLAAPKSAKLKVSQAKKAIQKNKMAEAEESIKSALEIYPEYAEAWFTLGQAQQMNNRIEEARKSFNKARSLDKNYVNPYISLAYIASQEENWRETASMSEQALSLDPISFIYGYYLNAMANYRLNELEAAEKRARQGQRLDTQNDYPQFYLLLAGIYTTKQDWVSASKELKNYRRTAAPDASKVDLVRSHIRKLEAMKVDRVKKQDINQIH
jgi:tetratricopeptide (TPR) repeat protein